MTKTVSPLTIFAASMPASLRYNPNTMRPMYEWETERDEATFVRHGYWCQIKRHPELRHLCGYVMIGKTHPYWGIDSADSILDVHGGVTCDDGTRIGFDCAHAGDLVPQTFMFRVNYAGGPDRKRIPDVYRNWAFVEREVDRLAKQLRDLDTRETTMTQPDPD